MKREEIALYAMQGILSNPNIFEAYKEIDDICTAVVNDSFEYADKFMEKINSKKEKKVNGVRNI